MDHVITLGPELRRRGRWNAYLGDSCVCATTQPLLDVAAVLLSEGVNPADKIVLMRGNVWSLRSTVGYAASRTVVNDRFVGRRPDAQISPPEPEGEPEPAPTIVTPREPEPRAEKSVAAPPRIRPPIEFRAPAPTPPRTEPIERTSGQILDWQPKPDGIGFTYFILACEGVRRIKIGTSQNPRNRLRDLSVASAVDLECLKVIRGGPATEAAWHQRFAESRVRGEWFRVCGTLMDAIRLADPAPEFPDMLCLALSPDWAARVQAAEDRQRTSWEAA
jgi:Meiotically up-regulated gene 113